MQNPKRYPIATKTLLHIAVWVSIVILLSTSVAFVHFRNNSETLYLAQIELYIKERLARERSIFLLAESNLEIIQRRFIQRFSAISRQEYLTEFDQLFEQQKDNTWRNSARYLDLNEYAGNFIDDDTALTEDIKKKAVLFFQIADQYGPAWQQQFANLYLIGRENFLSVYWPEVPWTQSVDTSIELMQEPYYFKQKPSNDTRKPQWTDVYYDKVAGKWLISVIAPLDLYGEQIGTVGQDLLVNDMLGRTLTDTFPGAFNFIFTRSGRVIAHPDLVESIYAAEGQLTVQEANNGLLLQAYKQALKHNSQSVSDYESSDFYLAISHLAEPDWFMVVAYPKEAVASQAIEDAKIVLQLGLLSLLVVLALVYGVLRRQVSRPLHSFIHTVDTIADGGSNIHLDQQCSEELNRLANSFLAMQKMVKDNMAQLNQEVSEKNVAQKELVQAHEALKEANDQLELRVLHRTASLHAANDELSSALHKLQDTQQQLVEAEKMSSLGGLVAGVAHEINTPIGICLTAASSLQDDLMALSRCYKAGEMTEQGFLDFLQLADESLQMLLSNNQRAAQLIQSFKQVAVDQSSEDKRHFLLKTYIQEILFSLQPKLKKTQHKIKVSCDESIELESYPGAFAQILTNLIMNSLIHGFEHKTQGNIIIEAHREDDQVCILYRDDGCGMSQEAVQRVFEPFFTTKRGGGGSGLGSHLVYNLVTQQLNGSIHCSSELSQGVVFIIRIPLHI